MKVGIAGTGFMGETHADCYKKIKNTELFAIAEKNDSKGKLFADKYKVSKIYKDVFEMINDPEIDIIDICLPTFLHARSAVYALNKNKNVLLEKPISLSLDDALSIKDAAEKSKGKFMLAQVLRFWPEYKAIRQTLCENNAIKTAKEIFALRFNEEPLWSEDTWIMDEKLSGGLIIDLMIHDVDFIIWTFGKAEKVFCNAIYNNNNYAIQVMAAFKMKNGAAAYIEGGYLNPSGAGLSTQMRIYGEGYLLEYYSNNSGIVLTRKNNPVSKIPVSGNDGYFEEINYFINCINENKEPEIITAQDAIDTLKVCLAMKESLIENKWIEIQ
jgi:predicted dehydrogenase